MRAEHLHPSRRPVRLALAGLAAIAAFATVAEHRIDAAGRRAVGEEAVRLGATDRDPLLAARLRYAPDAAGARRRLARALLSQELVPREGPLDAGGVERTLVRVETAGTLAGELLAERPAAWDAALVVGGGRYLARSLARDRRLITAAADWETPLATAAVLAPARPEPDALRAAAYLELWFALSPAKRELTRELLARGFADEESFPRLIEPWLLVAGDRDTAFALVPERSRAWSTIAEIYSRRRDWPGWAAAAQRRTRALAAELDARLEAAERRLTADPKGARELFWRTILDAPPATAFAPRVDRALARCPPGVVPTGFAPAFAAWLTWAVERDLAGAPGLAPAAVGRLAAGAGSVPPALAARAALAAGDLPGAERIERRSGALSGPEWTAYLVVKARRLRAAGHLVETAGALATIPARERAAPAVVAEHAALAAAGGDAREAARRQAERAALATSHWPATAWRWQQGTARLDVLTAAPAAGLEIELVERPRDGGVVEILWDGATLGLLPVGDRPLRLAVDAPAGLHRLELRAAAGGAPVPGAVRLMAPRQSGG